MTAGGVVSLTMTLKTAFAALPRTSVAAHVTAPEDVAAVEQVAETVVDLYVRMFREIGGEEPTWA